MSIGRLIVVVVVLALIIGGVGTYMGFIKMGPAGVSVTAPELPTGSGAPADLFDSAEVKVTNNDFAGAIVDYQNAIQKSPNSEKVPNAMYRIGYCYDQMGKAQECQDAFNAFVEKFPNAPHVREAQQRAEYYHSQLGK